MIHTVTLEEYHKAHYKHLKYVNRTKGVVGPVLRLAIAEGLLNEDDMVQVERDGVVVFEPTKVKTWTDYDIKEGDKGLVRIKYVPFSM